MVFALLYITFPLWLPLTLTFIFCLWQFNYIYILGMCIFCIYPFGGFARILASVICCLSLNLENSQPYLLAYVLFFPPGAPTACVFGLFSIVPWLQLRFLSSGTWSSLSLSLGVSLAIVNVRFLSLAVSSLLGSASSFLLFYIYVLMYMCICGGLCGGQGKACGSRLCLITMWIPGTEPRSSHLVASPFTH